VEEALTLAAPRRMRLDHADALLSFARLELDKAVRGNLSSSAAEAAAYRCGDNSDAALSIARECGYAWAERDALKLLTRSNELVGATERALKFAREATDWSDRLADSGPPAREP
jgi:hypothetical protein